MTAGRCDIPGCEGKHAAVYVFPSGREWCPCEDHHPGGRLIPGTGPQPAPKSKGGKRK